MPAPRVTAQELRTWRHQLQEGQHPLDASVVRCLMEEVERLRLELAQARVTFAAKAADALERRIQVVATYNHGGCPACRDAEARAFLAKLRKIQAEESGATTV